jgi:DNA sulfur modification protein DndE
MSSTHIKLSASATTQMFEVAVKLKLENEADLWVLRIAFARSLQNKTKINLSSKEEFQNQNISLGEKRKEIELKTLEQQDGILFKALLQQYYKIDALSLDDYSKYLKKHVEDGLNLLFEDTKKMNGYDYLVAIAKKGVESLGQLKKFENNEKFETASTFLNRNIIAIEIGLDLEEKKPFTINFNKTDEHNNSHIGIIGNSGSGKTSFVKYLLCKVRESSEFKTHFIIFDYVKGDISSDVQFIKETKAKVLNISNDPIPLNIFQIAKDEMDKKRVAERVVDIVSSIGGQIGEVQKHNLYTAIINAYNRTQNDEKFPFPDFEIVKQEIEKIRDTPDSLTSIFRPLTQQNLFAKRTDSTWTSLTLTNSTIIFDIHELPSLKELCVFFILNELHRQLMTMNDSQIDEISKAREMRLVIVIDEAHYFLSDKKRSKILEKLIREIRSKGVSIILISQSPNDYDGAEFDFLELLEFVYILNCNASSSKLLKQLFGSGENKLLKDLKSLKPGCAIGKGKEKEDSLIKPVKLQLHRMSGKA